MKKQQHFKIISIILILAFAIGLLTCGEEDSGDLGLMWIPAGTFWMGSYNGSDPPGIVDPPPIDPNSQSNETPVHKVTITKGFYMSRYLITQSQYYLVTGEEPSNFINVDGRGRLPVERVSWYDAIEFCNKLSIKHGLTPAYDIDGTDVTWNNTNGYRLPTEAEWEYACRAGTKTAYNTGNTISDDTGWYYGNTPTNPDTGSQSTQEVGLKPPNAWGLYDMHGNVSEWCWDRYGASYYLNSPSLDPTGAVSGSSRVIRGGSVGYIGQNLRSAFRSSYGPDGRYLFIGFRLVRP